MLNRVRQVSLYIMSAFYMLAGVNHFRIADFYLTMMPPYLPQPEFLVYLSGVFEILFGAGLLFSKTRAWAAWGIVLMLIVFLSVHVFMLQERETLFASVPAFILWIRLPGQALLIWWAYIYTNKSSHTSNL